MRRCSSTTELCFSLDHLDCHFLSLPSSPRKYFSDEQCRFSTKSPPDPDIWGSDHGHLAKLMYSLFQQSTMNVPKSHQRRELHVSSKFADPHWYQLTASIRSFYGLLYLYHLECEDLIHRGSGYEPSLLWTTSILQKLHSPGTVLSRWDSCILSVDLIDQIRRISLIPVCSQKCLLVCHSYPNNRFAQTDSSKWSFGLSQSPEWQVRGVYTPHRLSSMASQMTEPNSFVAFYLHYSKSHEACLGEQLCLAWYELGVLFRGACKTKPVYPSHYRLIRLNRRVDSTNWADFHQLCQSIQVCNIIVVEQGYAYALLTDPGMFLSGEPNNVHGDQGDPRFIWFVLRVPLTKPHNNVTARSSPLIPECFGPFSLNWGPDDELSPLITIGCQSDRFIVYEYLRNSDLIRHEMNVNQRKDSNGSYPIRTRISLRKLLGLSTDEVLLWMRCLTKERFEDLVLCHRFCDHCTPVISILRFPCGKRDEQLNPSVYPLYLFPIPMEAVDYGTTSHSLSDATAEYVLFWSPNNPKLNFCKLNFTRLVMFLEDSTSDITKLTYSIGNSTTQVLLELLDTAEEKLVTQRTNLVCAKPYRSEVSSITCLPVTRTRGRFYMKLKEQWHQLIRQSTDPHYSTKQRELYRAIASRISTWSANIAINLDHSDLSDSGCLCDDLPKLATDQNQFCDAVDLTDLINAVALPSIPRAITTCLLRFGCYGAAVHEFREPNGIAVMPDSTIAVADGNAEMIKFFSPAGQFIKAWKLRTARSVSAFPNCLALRSSVVASQLSSRSPSSSSDHITRDRSLADSPTPSSPLINSTTLRIADTPGSEETGDLVVVLRKPAPCVLIYSLNGNKIREFQGGLISPKCVAVDREDRIVVVESHIMRVNVYAWSGDVLARFQTRLAYPVSVAVDSAYCIYITDNLAHCVVVFNYVGDVLGTIGSRGLTNYPFGVTILNCDWVTTDEDSSVMAYEERPNEMERVVIVDNHNNLNISIFEPCGRLVHAMHSGIKHAQIYAIALDYRTRIDSNFANHPSSVVNSCQSVAVKARQACPSRLSLVVASKDFRIYRYPLPHEILTY
ncbi:hypothetical protein FGIG_01925 [Fasciola gigantica]|uniref:Uncharacterized protein n=1 Tax=Fasciola gigantica TaxID=46835 RepID=A0A504YVS4_FASGI|nr:hypothetical protein FGIG_01925 [Fasciola gigantica]